MGQGGGPGRGTKWGVAGAALLALGIMLAIGAAVTGEDPANARDDLPLLLLPLAGIAALVAWGRARAAAMAEELTRNQVEDELEDARKRLAAAEQEREAAVRKTRAELEREVEKREAALRETREELEAEVRKRDAALKETREELQSRLQERERALDERPVGREPRREPQRDRRVERRDWIGLRERLAQLPADPRP